MLGPFIAAALAAGASTAVAAPLTTRAAPTVVQKYTTSAGPTYSYQACYSDLAYGTRALPMGVATSTRTVEACLDACAKSGYKLCGVEYHGECWGGNALDKTSTKQDESACNLECWDNPAQVCGGVGGDTKAAMNLYSVASLNGTTTTTTTAPVATATGPSIVQSYNSTAGGNWQYQECYSDLVNGRALPNGLSTKARTVEACLDACESANYALCGVEYHGECWGGNTLGAGSTVQGAKACGLTCWDNDKQICGGQGGVSGAAMNLYKLAGSNNTAPGLSDNSTTIASTKLNTEDWSYTGCYQDLVSNVRTLPNALSASWSTSACLAAADAANYTVAGVTYGGECWAANALSPSAKKTDTDECDWRCNDNKNQTCGADKLLDIYTSTRPLVSPGLTAEQVKTYGNWTYSDCYSDRVDIRSLSQSFDNPKATVDSCLDICEQNGAKVCGLSYYGECYGGSSLNSISTVIDDSKCSSPCRGNSQQLCGGSEALSVFVLTTRCPERYVADQTARTCTPCADPSALTCSADGKTALTCGESSFLLDGECLESCPAHFRDNSDDQTCTACADEDALTCTADAALSCEKLYLIDGACIDCPPTGHFVDNGVCTACAEDDAATCDASGSLSCKEGFLVGKSCKTSCGDGFFQDDEAKTCTACTVEGAATCTTSADVASSCSSGLLKDGQCVESCGAGFFPDAEAKTCAACTVDGAATCTTSADVASSCASGFLKNGACPSACGNGFFQDAEAKVCSPCTVDGAATCTTSADVASSCSSGFLKDGQCASSCGDGSFQDASSKVCTACTDSDATACPTSASVATSCKTKKLWQGACVEKCPIGTRLSDGAPVCKACDEEAAATCSEFFTLSCKEGYLFDTEESRCISPNLCAAFTGWFSDSANCSPCRSKFTNSASCSSTKPLTCATGYELDIAGKNCVKAKPTCDPVSEFFDGEECVMKRICDPSEYYEATTNTCGPCDMRFQFSQTCTAEAATSCAAAYFLEDGKCTDCAERFWHAETCSATKPLTCSSGYQLNAAGTNCAVAPPTCSSTQYLDTSSNSCKSCSSKFNYASTCTATEALSCSISQMEVVRGLCQQKNCRATGIRSGTYFYTGQFVQDRGNFRTCTDCYDPNAWTCDSTGKTVVCANQQFPNDSTLKYKTCQY
ncbi:hypothetical protein JCM6882_008833 [Rhodosporidiobolus microsporus]